MTAIGTHVREISIQDPRNYIHRMSRRCPGRPRERSPPVLGRRSAHFIMHTPSRTDGDTDAT